MSRAHPTFPIVGVGASAGGLEALEGFFRGMPDDPGIAVVIVTHLGPDRQSLLPQIIERYTSLAVRPAADGDQIERNSVYVLNESALLTVEKGRLSVKTLERLRRERKPIDIFFSSLAADQCDRAVGIILSGGDGDGTLGVKAIKERGGITMAQTADGFGPSHPDMPETAISAGQIDLAIPVEEMGGKLAELARGGALLDGAEVSLEGDSDARLNEAREEIYDILRNQVGHQFSGYKPKTFTRRVHRRMQIVQLNTVQAYVERLRQDPEEVRALFRDLLINVTNFFRDAPAFSALSEHVIPKLLDGRGADELVRVWVPGCATGEEVFSLAILMREAMDGLNGVPRVQIFATDIDEHALAVARAGRYPETLLEGVSPERRARFFIPDGGSYAVTKEVRDMCVFSPHSVIRDPPFSRMDLISCRNLLIYLASEAQGHVIPIFHYSLRPGGYLFLGMSENVSQYPNLFEPVDKKHRIFRARDDVPPALHLPLSVGQYRPLNPGAAAPRSGASASPLALRHAVESQVLDRFAPTYVVVDRQGEAVYFSAKTGRYLEAAAGLPSRNLLALARKGLRSVLRAALGEATKHDRRAARANVPVEGEDGHSRPVTVTVDPLHRHAAEEPLYIVLFAEAEPPAERGEADGGERGQPTDLERELRETRDRLQAQIEEAETAVEELKSSNEELMSVNEELQSTNEELEASKEELQSLNEELNTVNAELNGKIAELDQVNSDLENLFESTDVALVFLDRQLRIRGYTPAVSKIFSILPADKGRPITDLSSRFPLPSFSSDIEATFTSGEACDRFIADSDSGAHYLMRLAPYRSVEGIDGVVVTFVDVTALTEAEAQQRVLINELQHRTRNLVAVIRSISAHAIEGSADLAAFKTRFESRLTSLARLQDLLSLKHRKLSLETLIRTELDALVRGNGNGNGNGNGHNVIIDGPDVLLNGETVQTLALALHELATNALKHGALRGDEGRLSVTWRIEDGETQQRRLHLVWLENGPDIGPADDDKAATGYGRTLIERALPYELGAETLFEITTGGVRCEITVPLHRITRKITDPC